MGKYWMVLVGVAVVLVGVAQALSLSELAQDEWEAFKVSTISY